VLTWKDRAIELKDKHPNMAASKIARQLQAERTDVDMNYTNFYQAVNRVLKGSKTHEPQKRVVGVFSDIHAPFNHPNYLNFVKDTFDCFGVTDVIINGDLTDNHAISRHQTEPNAVGSLDEYYKAKEEIQKVVEMFPVAKMTIGNHDAIPKRQIATLAMPEIFLKDYHQLWGLPETWEIEDYYIIDNVLYCHGLNCGGKDGALNKALQERMSVVIGHYHAFLGCKYTANSNNIIFGMNTGCGIDIDAYAFVYGRNAKYRPTLGCGVVKSGSEAYAIPMQEKYFRG